MALTFKQFKSIFWPPGMVGRQASSMLYYQYLVGWKKFPHWLFKHSFKSLPVAAGSVGMGCIGFPAHPAWEVTSACNLRCVHCHATGDKPAEGELDTAEAKLLIEQMAAVNEFRMLVYTGGEPLVRPDLIELLHHSKEAGLTNVIATNGILITDEKARELKRAGVAGAAVSIDSTNAAVHNRIRVKDDAFELTLRGIEALRKAGILLQINVTAMEYNFDDLENIIELATRKDSGIMLMYQLVPVGRGSEIAKAALNLKDNERLIKKVAACQVDTPTVIEPVAGPQYWPYLLERKKRGKGVWLKMAEQVFHGCAAGRGFVYIKSNGDVWPCPFVEVNAGNVRDSSFEEIWNNSEVFQDLRDRENRLKGKCGDCKYSKLCGGCRGRAHAYTGDYLAEDPSCFIDSDEI